MIIKDKLTELQYKLGVNSAGMAELLGIKKAYYSLIFNGKRKPSKNLIMKLSIISGRPIEYWDGTVEEYIQERSFLEKTSELLTVLIDNDLINNIEDIEDKKINETLMKAIKTDLKYKLKMKQRDKEKQQ